MVLPSTLTDRFMAWRGASAQVKLYYRRMRDGDIPPTAENMASFEGAMVALDFEAAGLIEEACSLVRQTADVIQGALALLDEAEAEERFPSEREVGEIVGEARRHRDLVRSPDPLPVYVPNEGRGWLQDMATPVAPDNVLPFQRRSGGGVS